MDSLGDRMKQYEAATYMVLPRRTYTIIRVDGRAFHTLLRGSKKPFDWHFIEVMDKVTKELAKAVDGSVVAYTQSDEISLVLQDFKNHNTTAWFGGVIQKQASLAASIATYHFNTNGYGGIGLFDARTYTIPSKTEVMNYLVWRQKDAQRNATHMIARAFFSHKALQGKKTWQMVQMLEDTDIFLDEYPPRARNGGWAIRGYTEDSPWVVNNAPDFSAKPGSSLDGIIPTLE